MSGYQIIQDVGIHDDADGMWIASEEDCQAILSIVSLLTDVGLSSQEIEDDVLETFTFLDDCVIDGRRITISVVQGPIGAITWRIDEQHTWEGR